MALKDCIEKLGVVSPQDEAKLVEYLAAGMTDEQAVMRLLIESNVDVISIADRVRQGGVELKVPADTLAEVQKIADARFEKLIKDRAKTESYIELLKFEYSELMQTANIVDNMLAQGARVYDTAESMDDNELLMRLGQIMFDPETKENLRNGYMEIESLEVTVREDDTVERTEGKRRIDLPQGATPKEVLASIKAHEQKRRRNRKNMVEARDELQNLNVLIDQILGESFDQTFYQSVLPDYMGLFSGLENAIAEMNLPEWKAGKEAKGKVVAQKIRKMPGVKKEELEWTGFLDLLESAPEETFSRDQLRRFVQQHGVIVEETETDPTAGDQTESLDFWDAQIWDDPEAWEYQVEEMMDDFNADYPPTGAEDPLYWFDIDDWFGQREDEIANDYGFDEEQMEKLDRTGNTLAEVAADMGYDIYADYENDVTEAAQEAAEQYAEESYYENPIYIQESQEHDIYIFGNDDQGYIISEGGPGNQGTVVSQNEIWSLNEAQIQAEAYARDAGYLIDEESEFAPRWSEFVEDDFGGYDNYREIKLKLPDVEGTFVQTVHFGDEENIVAFLRVTDRRVPDRNLWTRTVSVPERDFDPADYGLREVTVAEAKHNHEQGSTVILGSKTWNEDDQQQGWQLQPMRDGPLPKLFFDPERVKRRGDRHFIVDVAGQRKNTFFVDEFQSDWHQQGRQYGYADPEVDAELHERRTQLTADRLDAVARIMDEVQAYVDANPELEPRMTEAPLAEALKNLETAEAGRIIDRLAEGVESDTFPAETRAFAQHLEKIMFEGDTSIGSRQLGVGRTQRETVPSPALTVFFNVSNQLDEVLAEQTSRRDAVPNAPFKDDAWLALGLKRALVKAMEYSDQFAWADAEVLLKRWGNRAEEMYRNQYDKKMPSIVRKLTGQKPRHLGENGQPAREGEIGYWVIDLTPELKQKIKSKGFPLFQGRKGSITFTDVPGQEIRQAMIRMFKEADASTMIHEAGHLYLELMGYLASQPDASEYILHTAEVTLNYLGVDSFDAVETKHHELFAESFEKYTIEGKAPSISMQDAFGSFQTWLLETYRTVRGVRDIELSDEIRKVFDRMLATDEEIALAEANMDYAPLYLDAEQAGMTDREFEIYKRGLIRAHNEEVAKQSSKLLKAMKQDQEAWWREEYKREEAQVRLRAYEERVFNARAFLMTGKLANGLPGPRAPFKLDRDSVLAVLSGDETLLKKLPHTGAYGIYRRKGGVDVDLAAQFLGYTDGLEMLEDLLNAPDMETWIAATTKMVMKEKYPDPFKDGSMAGAAIRAVHSTQRADIIAAEMRQLRKQMRETKPIVRATEERIKKQRRDTIAANKGSLPKREEIQMIRRAAAERIRRMRIREVKPHVYLRAERKAAREAFAAFERGDLEAAYEAKRRQLVNFEMYRAAVKAGDSIQKTHNYLRSMEKPAKQQKLGKAGVLNQILGILEGTDLRKKSLAQVDLEEALTELSEKIDNGELIVAPEMLKLIKSDMTNWQNLTVNQFDAMKEIIQQLEHSADYRQKVHLNDETMLLDDVIGELEEQLANSKQIDLYGGKKSKGETGTDLAKQALNVWLRPGTLARVLDKAGWGAITRRIVVPMRRAYAEKYIPRVHEMQERLADIYLKHFSLKDMNLLYKRTIKVKGHKKKYSRADALMIAMNQGNEGNQKALAGSLVEGEQIYPQHMIDTLLGTLTESDWRFVQQIWDYFEEFYPEIKEAEERRRGVAPEQVQAKPLTVRTADGKVLNLRGGYFPIVHDSTLSDRVKQQEVEEIATNMGLGVYVSASTRASATYLRTARPGLPVRLDLNVIDTHLRDVIRDLSIGDEVQSIQKILNDKRFRSAMRKTGNLEALKQMNLWLTDAAVGESPANHVVVKTARWVRGGFVKARLGLSATVTLLQFTGWFQSMAAIGTKTLAIGLGKFAQNPIYWWKQVPKMSAFIKARYEIGAWNRDVQDVQSHIDSWFGVVPTIGKRTFNLIGAALFMPIKYAQKAVDITTWLAGYEQGRNEQGLDDQEAVYFADAMVENAQTSGFFSDRSPLERGTLTENIRQAEYVRIWTTLIGYMLAKGNIAYEKTKDTSFKDPKQVLAWSLDMVLLFTIEGMASAIIYGNWPEDDDDTGETEYAKWVAKTTLDSMASGVPFIREVPQQRYGSGSTPLGALFKDTLEFYDQAAQGEVDEAFVKRVIDLAGYTHVVPSSQLNRTLDAIWDEDDTTLLEYATGPRDED